MQIAFLPEALQSLAEYAFRVIQTTQNIGTRRLHTIKERLLEVLSFDASDSTATQLTIDVAFVQSRIEGIADNEDLNKYIL